MQMRRRLKLSDVRLLNVDVFWFLSSSGKEINWDIWRRNTDPHFQHSITFYWPTADRLTEEIIKILMSVTTTISRSCASQSSHVIGQADVPRLKKTFNTFLKERWSPLVEWWRPAGCSGMWFLSLLQSRQKVRVRMSTTSSSAVDWWLKMRCLPFRCRTL